MASLMQNISHSSIHSNDIRIELNRYIVKVNFIILFVQAFICLSGVLGNIFALIVINRKSLRNTSSAVFITYMAIFDSAVLICHAASLLRPRKYRFLHCLLICLLDLSTFCANWVLVIITLERCVAVYSPFLAKRLCTVSSARHSMYILLSVSILFFSITSPFIYETDDKISLYKCLIQARAVLILRIYQPIVFYAIPDLFLLSNLFTVYALCQRRQRLTSISSKNDDTLEMRVTDIHSSRKQRQLTAMLVTVSLSFYLFTTPAMILYINEYFPPSDRQLSKRKAAFLFSQTSVVLLQLSNATNFIFYCLAGQRFRQATMHTFHEYSAKLKIFYHRYILCDKQYSLIYNNQYQLSRMGHTGITSTIRDSCSPIQRRIQYRASVA